MSASESEPDELGQQLAPRLGWSSENVPHEVQNVEHVFIEVNVPVIEV